MEWETDIASHSDNQVSKDEFYHMVLLCTMPIFNLGQLVSPVDEAFRKSDTVWEGEETHLSRHFTM